MREATTHPSPAGGARANGWLALSQPNPEARLRLFCFPYAGGNDAFFRTWQKSLPSFVEVCRVLLPGRGARLQQPPYRQLALMVEAIGEALTGYMDKPFALFGHSMGAMISFELARYLRRHNRPQPVELFVSGRSAPQMPQIEPPTYDLPDEEFREELRRLKGTPEEVLSHPELMQLMTPILRADFSVCQTYVYTPEPPLDCPITAFGGADDSETQAGRLEAWREQTTAGFSMQVFPGGHFFIHEAQPLILRLMANRLSQLARVAEGGMRMS